MNGLAPNSRKIMLKTLLCSSLFVLSAHVGAAPPTDESLDELLKVSRIESTLDQVYASMDKMIRQSLAQAAAGQPLSEEQQRVLDAAPARLAAVLRSELNWAEMRPIYVAIYKESLEQSDVDAMIAFYKTPAGQAVLAKLPAILQRSMSVAQARLQTVIPKLKGAMEEVLREAKLPVQS